MIRETVHALAACVVTFVLCAVAYPAAVWGLGQLLFPDQAEGSLVYGRDRMLVGSELIAQPFASDKYFSPRPSAVDYKADAAGGSNLGTKNPDLRDKVKERAEALKATPDNPAPVDLVSASGSGLDPHISPEAAYYQATRVAAARKLPVGASPRPDRPDDRATPGRSSAHRRASTCCSSTSPWTRKNPPHASASPDGESEPVTGPPPTEGAPSPALAAEARPANAPPDLAGSR